MEDDSSTLGPARNLSWNCSGRAALKREQREQLESKHREKPSHMEEGETKHIHRKHSLREKKKWRYFCRLFRTKSLKEGAMLHVDLLLGIDRRISKYTKALAK
jgi:hypothetical protein